MRAELKGVMAEVFLDAFIDSLKVLAVLVVVNFLFSALEPKLAGKIKLKGKYATLVGVSLGLLPQCGFSVVATDLYQKRHISIGTLLGIYLATSDEALPIFLADPEKALHILPILAMKFLIGLAVGYSADLIYKKSAHTVDEHSNKCEHEPEIHIGCCGHEIESKKEDDCHNHNGNDEERIANVVDDEKCCDVVSGSDLCKDTEDAHRAEKKAKIKQYLVHPLVHSLKIFAYILVINIIFGIVIYSVGENKILEFLKASKYVAPLYAVIIGMIPNCASSVVLSNLYLIGGLGVGATVGGLCMNAGIAFTVLFRNIKAIKENLTILLTMFLVSVAVAYIVSAIFNFDALPI